MRSTLSLIALALAASACGQQPGSAAPDAAGADAATGVDAGSPSGADAGVGPDASAPAPFAGDCSPALPSIATQPWRDSAASALTTIQGAANHRTRDQIASPGEQVSVRGRFTYGVFDKDLEGEDVEVWLRRCPDWVKLGVFTTDGEGIIFVPMPADLPKGEYRLHFQVLGDATSAEGVFAVWPSGTQAVVTDIDGTLTTDDWQAVQDVIGLGEAVMHPDADAVMRAWAAKGYRLLYLTGRPQVVNRYTRAWVEERGFPPGPVQLTDSADQIWPTDSSVRAFKADRLSSLATGKGISWRAAYGNATTDIGAYADAVIPKADTFIIGANAGADGTQAVGSYTAHLPDLTRYPAAVQP